MPKLMPVLLALVTCICVFSPMTNACANTAFVTVGFTKQAPVIDGVLDDPCWDDCIELSNFLSLTDNGIPAIEDTKVYITLNALNEEGKGMHAVRSQEIKGTSDWTRVKVEFTVPKDADTFRILFGVNGVGTGWCGDMKLTKIP